MFVCVCMIVCALPHQYCSAPRSIPGRTHTCHPCKCRSWCRGDDRPSGHTRCPSSPPRSGTAPRSTPPGCRSPRCTPLSTHTHTHTHRVDRPAAVMPLCLFVAWSGGGTIATVFYGFTDTRYMYHFTALILSRSILGVSMKRGSAQTSVGALCTVLCLMNKLYFGAFLCMLAPYLHL